MKTQPLFKTPTRLKNDWVAFIAVSFMMLFVHQSSIAQTVFFDFCTNVIACSNPIEMVSDGTVVDGGITRNTYTSFAGGGTETQCPEGGGLNTRVIWNASSNRWEIDIDGSGGVPDYTDIGVAYYSTFASHPNPPDMATGGWVATNALDDFGCSGLAQLNGSGTQNFLAATAPEMDVSVGATAISDESTTITANVTDFGSECVSGGTSTITYTVTNSGDADLSLSGSPRVVISGGDAGDFSVTTQPAASVPHTTSNTTTFVVEFDPTSTGARATTISIANDDSNENPYNFSIEGTGINPTVTVAINGNTSEAENSGNAITFRFSRDCTVGALVANFSIAGTGMDNDYTVSGETTYSQTTNTGTITFLDGNATVDLLVTPTGDTDIEPDETVIVTVANP